LYSAPVAIAVTTTLKAKAFLTDWGPSPTTTGVYTITGTVAASVFAPPAGIYTTAQNVTITCATPGAQIRYTTNGTEPTVISTLYSTPVAISATTPLKAKAFLTDWEPSETTTGVYTITGTVAMPLFSSPGGLYLDSLVVSLSAEDADSLYYAVNEGDFAIFNEPISLAPEYTG
jgi:chitinase